MQIIEALFGPGQQFEQTGRQSSQVRTNYGSTPSHRDSWTGLRNLNLFPARTYAAAFHPRRGQEIIQKYTFLPRDCTWRQSNLESWIGRP